MAALVEAAEANGGVYTHEVLLDVGDLDSSIHKADNVLHLKGGAYLIDLPEKDCLEGRTDKAVVDIVVLNSASKGTEGRFQTKTTVGEPLVKDCL